MSLDTLRDVLEELPDPSFVEGTAKLSERFAIALPDGDLGTLDDPMFVEWLLEHGEVAPFGDKGETKLDASVRNAKRLRARGAASITGFDVAGVLPAIEAALSPRCHLEAQLEDVIVYTTGGKFARHKDTPRTAALVGTLVVGLPIEHRGGAFTITDGGKAHAIDWSGVPTPDTVRWVALFSDVDHEIDEVTSGARVTLVYSLSRSARPRTDATREARLARLKAEVSKLQLTDDLLIACTRHIVTDGTQPQSIDTLRGTDREIADVFVEAGFQVAVRACIAGGGDNDVEGAMDDIQDLYGVARLAKAIPASVIADMDSAVSFTDEIDMEEYAEDGVEPGGVTLGGYIHDHTDLANWVIRPRARATAIYEGMYSETGYFGNEASYGHIYALAAIEVTRRP